MSICCYGWAKQCDLPELEMVFYSRQGVGTEVNQTIGVKRTTDGEADSSESKRGTYEKIAPKTRAKIAKYTVENKIPAAAIHHYKKTGCKNTKQNF